MNIAVLGWGSLIWCPGSLRIATRWRKDGPSLPLEFARISRDGRLTLVIYPPAPSLITYWALSAFNELPEARTNLSEREGTSPSWIHSLSASEHTTENMPAAHPIRLWLKTHSDIDAVIWTGLENNWTEKRGVPFSPEDAVTYLTELETQRPANAAVYDRAREYVTNAPTLIQTEVRRRLQKEGWNDATLPDVLFE